MNIAEVLLAALLWGIAGSALIVFACELLTRLRRLKAGAARTLWFGAIVLMGILPLAAVGASFARATHAPPETTTGATRFVKIVLPDVRGGSSSHAQSHPRTPGAVPAPEPRMPASAPAASDTQNATNAFAGWLIAAAAVGALAGVGSLLYSLARLRAIKRRSSPLDDKLSHDLPWLAETIEGRETYLRLSYEIETPIAIGFGRPVILIPTDLANENGLRAIESLVVHEHAHLKNYDDYTNLAQRFIERLYWFNPFVWYAGRKLALAREMAADDAVIERGADRAGYAQSLWRLAREMRMPSQPIVAPGALFTRKQISQRIEALLAANRGQFTPLDPSAIFAGVTLAFIAYGLVIWLTPAYRLPALPETALGAWPSGAADPVIASPPPLPLAAPEQIAAAAASVAAAAAEARAQASAVASAAAESVQSGGLVERITSKIRGHFSRSGSHSSRSVVIGCTNGCDLDGHDFSRVELRDISFSGSSMDKANFAGARLHNVGFDGASLDGANFDGAELRSVRFDGASIDGATFIGAKIDRPSFHGVDLSSAHFDSDGLRAILESGCAGCDFSGMKMRGIDLSGVTLSGVNLSDVDLTGANLRGAHLTGVQLDDAKLDDADLTDAVLSGCSLSGTSTKNTKLDHITLIGSSFS